MKKITKGSVEKLKNELGTKVFVVSKKFNSRLSTYGKLESVNEGVNIVLGFGPPLFGDQIVPLNNDSDKILKVYNAEGYIVYDNE